MLEHLNSKWKSEWTETVEKIDMKHSSWKAWATINKLTGRKHISPNPNSMNPNAIALCLMKNDKFKQPSQLNIELNSKSVDQDFSSNEVMITCTQSSFYTLMKSASNGCGYFPQTAHSQRSFQKCKKWRKWYMHSSWTHQLITLAAIKPLVSYVYCTNFTSVWSTIESNLLLEEQAGFRPNSYTID